MSFEHKLQNLRKKAGLSQEEMANQLGVSRQAVSKWESGTSYPEMDKLILMTKLFKCTLDDLVNDDVKEVDTNNKMQSYKDSLLDFISKSISMFTSMKSSSAFKCLIEMCVFILGLVCITAIVYSIGEGIFSLIFDRFYIAATFLSSIFLLVLIALDLIIIFQFYKIRYLDYFDEIVYKNRFKNDKVTEEKQINELKEESNNKVQLSHKKEERIIIRDPENKPLVFLSTISKMIMFIYKCTIRVITIPFLFLFTFLTITSVILMYLISYNKIFIGASITGVAAIVITGLVIRTLNDDLFKGKYPIKIMAFLFIGSLLVGSVGAGLSIISLKDFEYKKSSNLAEVNETIDYNDKLYLNFLSAADGIIEFVSDDTLDDILVSFEYDSRALKYEFTNPAGDDNYLLLNRMYIDEFDYKEYIQAFFDNLKHNIILDYGYYRTNDSLTIRTKEENIKKLIKNISEKNDIYVNRYVSNGVGHYVVHAIDTTADDSLYCGIDDYYRKCFRIIDETNNHKFTYEVKNNELFYSEEYFICNKQADGYTCYDKD